MDALENAIHDTAHGEGRSPAKLAKAIGVGYQVFINKTNPGCDTHHLFIHQALALMIATGDASIYHAIGQELIAAGVLNNAEVKPLFQAVVAASSEHGDVDRAISEALQDGRISKREKARMIREVDEAIAALNDLKASIFAIDEGAMRVG